MSFRIDTTVALNLRALRLKHHMTQQELAEKANISKQTISNLEKGQGATSKTIERLAECLDTSPLSFYKEVDNNEDTKLKRVSLPKANRFNPNNYTDKLETIITQISDDTKDFMYKFEIYPAIKNVFEENLSMFFDELNIEINSKNKHTYFSLENVLLDTIKQSIYQSNDIDNDDDIDELI